MTFHHWSLTEWFPLCSMTRTLFTHWDSCSTLDSICPHWWFPHLCRQSSLLVVIQRVFFHALFTSGAHVRDVLCGGPFNISSESFQIFGLLLLLMLDDGGCLNSLLPMDLFLSTSTHLALGQGSRVIISTLGLAVISGRFPHY
jgi:hypothetical protein